MATPENGFPDAIAVPVAEDGPEVVGAVVVAVVVGPLGLVVLELTEAEPGRHCE
jgi:hypothetical protein